MLKNDNVSSYLQFSNIKKQEDTEKNALLSDQRYHKKYFRDACYCVCYLFMYMAQDLNFLGENVILRLIFLYFFLTLDEKKFCLD